MPGALTPSLCARLGHCALPKGDWTEARADLSGVQNLHTLPTYASTAGWIDAEGLRVIAVVGVGDAMGVEEDAALLLSTASVSPANTATTSRSRS